jgi:hypothetical protein
LPGRAAAFGGEVVDAVTHLAAGKIKPMPLSAACFWQTLWRRQQGGIGR